MIARASVMSGIQSILPWMTQAGCYLGMLANSFTPQQEITDLSEKHNMGAGHLQTSARQTECPCGSLNALPLAAITCQHPTLVTTLTRTLIVPITHHQ